MVWHAESALPKGTDLVVVPGGFSYGDYLRCGAIAARAPVMDAVRKFAADGGLVLGVCNGFQILCEAGLLPGVLMRNARLKFICKDVHLRVERSDTPFTRGYNAGQVIRVPVAHGEGNYEADEETVKRLEGEGRVLYRYCSAEGVVDEESNINGAAQSIAGIVNERGNVLGMMPHPVTGETGVDLKTAKHWIDVLGMLEEKTHGNLDEQEAQMLENLLADLRMQYVSFSSSPTPPPAKFSASDITGGK